MFYQVFIYSTTFHRGESSKISKVHNNPTVTSSSLHTAIMFSSDHSRGKTASEVLNHLQGLITYRCWGHAYSLWEAIHLLQPKRCTLLWCFSSHYTVLISYHKFTFFQLHTKNHMIHQVMLVLIFLFIGWWHCCLTGDYQSFEGLFYTDGGSHFIL